MELFAIFLILLLFSGATLYLLVCIDPNAPGLFGFVHRLVFYKMPVIIRRLIGDRAFNFFTRIINYMFYTNHPLVQFFYILVAVGGYIVYALYGFLHLFNKNPEVNEIHSMIGTALAMYSFYSYYQACHYSAGIINQKNVNEYIEEFKDYYDGILYMKDNQCKTCNFVKPARSKHCRICNYCVSRFDHHCVWIKQCVGQKNYKYFLKFIGMHALLTDYGAWLGIKALYGVALKQKLFQAQFRNPVTKEVVQASYTIVFKYLFFQETMFIFITLLCIIMGVTLSFFFLYHLSMLRVDTTTNERMKSSDFKQFFKDEAKQLKESGDSKNKDKIAIFERNYQILNRQRLLGVIQGWKKVFSQPDEVKWKAERRYSRYKQKDE